MNLRKQTIDDVKLRGSASSSARTLTSPSTSRFKSPMTPAFVQRCRPSTASSTKARWSFSVRTWDAPRSLDPRYSLAPVAKRLSRLLGKEVIFAPDCIGPAVEKLVAKMNPGDVMLLEIFAFTPVKNRTMTPLQKRSRPWAMFS